MSRIPVNGSRPFAAFDIDGTLIRWQLYHAVTDGLARLGYLAPSIYNDIRQARAAWKMRTHAEAFKSYEHLMIKGFEQIIQNITVKQFETAVDTVIEEYKDQVYTYSRNLLKSLRQKGYMLFAISGSQRELVGRVAAYYGFDDFIGTDYLKRSGQFTGEKHFYAHDKRAAVQKLMDAHGLNREGSLAVGDSMSDIPMLEMVDTPIAFNPEEKLYTHARQAGWTIVLERKNTIYQLESHDGTYVLV